MGKTQHYGNICPRDLKLKKKKNFNIICGFLMLWKILYYSYSYKILKTV